MLFQIVDDLMSPWAMVPIRDLQDILPGAMGQTDLTFNPVSLLNSQAWGLEMPILQGTEAPKRYALQSPTIPHANLSPPFLQFDSDLCYRMLFACLLRFKSNLEALNLIRVYVVSFLV